MTEYKRLCQEITETCRYDSDNYRWGDDWGAAHVPSCMLIVATSDCPHRGIAQPLPVVATRNSGDHCILQFKVCLLREDRTKRLYSQEQRLRAQICFRRTSFSRVCRKPVHVSVTHLFSFLFPPAFSAAMKDLQRNKRLLCHWETLRKWIPSRAKGNQCDKAPTFVARICLWHQAWSSQGQLSTSHLHWECVTSSGTCS